MEEHRIKVLHHMSSEEEDDENTIVPKMVIFLNVVFRPIIGILMGIRGMYDGRLSLLALLLSLMYFCGFIVVIYIDTRFENCEKYSRILPKFFGIVVATAQLSGTWPQYNCDYNSDWRKCV